MEMKDNEARLLARAIVIAAEVHKEQRDKAGAPYILHPIRLMMKAKTPDEQMVAVLHDVLEDSEETDKWTVARLRSEGFPLRIVDAVDALTHRAEESYDESIDRVLADPLATEVKFLDLEDNMSLIRLTELTDKDMERVQKYHKAHRRLLEARAMRSAG